MAKKTIQDLDLKGKRAVFRVDFNVPLRGDEITDKTRILGALPTIRYVVEQGGTAILLSHLGRPKGEVNAKYSLAPVAKVLADELGQPVFFVPESRGPAAEKAVSELSPGSVALMENVRFHVGEEKNDLDLAQDFSKLGDVFINDAFGTAHRAHASTVGIAQFLKPAVAGLLIQRELEYLGDKTENAESPFVVILGGAKVSDKITVIDRLLDKADTILIGGAMAYTFALALGKTVGDSLSEPAFIDTAKAALKKAKEKGVKFLLPVDNVTVDSLDFDNMSVGNIGVSDVEGNIRDGWEGVDIGPQTVALYAGELANAKTILMNGPMGIFEIEACSKGSFAIAEAVAKNKEAISIIGGGDSVKAVNQAGFGGDVSFISTGGGASLEFLEGKALPGVEALDEK
ncbi:phosphoglycerate kinase [Candidatus Pelagisphaera phototrophica]|uniref:phosphoglycerate kinase n=1 Tax=Candidatus Pelagisphaera phototrophica TaxID=2684113 RepID=UPI0024B7CB4B|nr:phosphoglycerate kinase [Candidatus Pelagisphaera phototrophica]QXD32912.1 phosphoglycerate kinase [Candidatus Pelagisphaera phototrophica]